MQRTFNIIEHDYLPFMGIDAEIRTAAQGTEPQGEYGVLSVFTLGLTNHL